MPLFKSTPIKKLINGIEVLTSDNVVVTESKYYTNGESTIVVKDTTLCDLFLDSKTTNHVVVKALTNVSVKGDSLIDEEFEEIELDRGSCVEFKKIGDFWYILSSDGLKDS